MEIFNRQAIQQGLSLSLSSEQPGYRPPPPVAVISPRGGEGSSSVSGVSNGNFGMQSLILGSKYLKVAQQILDEVVSVGDHVVKAEEMKEMLKVDNNNNNNNSNKESMTVSPGEGSTRGKHRSELTTAEKQEFQMKKAKLVSMLDEVEQRYRQYHQQMQIVVTSFEQAAGLGSAKSYTALALQTISKQFRCLKDAISAQIKATSKSLGEDEICLTGKVEGSRLKFVDHQLRQQRALQQLGMMQQNAWRPQRGLPERAVSVLRAWLFEHFLHPYPKDSDKHMLAKQTGLTRSQVSNWFINARVRLWKPMVEEMYTEEFKEQEQQNGSGQNTSKTETNKQSNSKSTSTPQDITNIQLDQIQTLNSKQEHEINHNTSPTKISTSPTGFSFQSQPPFFINTPKKSSRSEMQNSPTSTILSTDMDTKHSTDINKGLIINEFLGGTSSGFGLYEEQLTTNFHGNGVSLSLGLPHCENYLSNQTIQFGSRHETEDIDNHFNGINILQASHSNPVYENMNIQNKKRFAAQLLQNFVA